MGQGSEFHRGSSLFFAGRFKERLLLKAEHSRDNHGGEYLNLRVQLGDGVIVKLPCISYAIFRTGQFFLQRNEVLVGRAVAMRFSVPSSWSWSILKFSLALS